MIQSFQGHRTILLQHIKILKEHHSVQGETTYKTFIHIS